MLGRHLEITLYRAGAELKRDAARSYLGVAWWFLEPILYMAVFYLVFGLGMRRSGPDYVVYLLAGLVVWKWLDGAVRSASGVILGSIGLMQQVYLPKLILPALVVVMHTYKFAIVFGVYLLFLLIGWEVSATQYWISLPLLIFTQLLFVCGMAFLASALVPLIPDLKYLVDFGMTLLFFMSGIFFDINDLTPEIKVWLEYNPMVFFIDSYRDVLLYGQWPDWANLAEVLLISLGVMTMACWILLRLDRYYPRVV